MARFEWFPEAALAKLDKAVAVGMDNGGNTLARIVKTEKLSGNPLDVRTGKLRNSITHVVGAGGYSVRVGTNVEYAPIHEFGGVIRPKAKRYLTIPIGPMRKVSLTAKFRSARDVPDLFVIRRKGKAPILARNKFKGRGSKRVVSAIEPMFLLARQVSIPRRAFLRPALYENRERVASAIANGIRREMKR